MVHALRRVIERASCFNPLMGVVTRVSAAGAARFQSLEGINGCCHPQMFGVPLQMFGVRFQFLEGIIGCHGSLLKFLPDSIFMVRLRGSYHDERLFINSLFPIPNFHITHTTKITCVGIHCSNYLNRLPRCNRG